MVLWHDDLSVRSAKLAALPDTAAVRQLLADFITKVDAHTMRLDEYGVLLGKLAAPLRRISAGLGNAAALDPLIERVVSASTARAREKAHRDFLLALRHVI
jgi:hypothetical protein